MHEKIERMLLEEVLKLKSVKALNLINNNHLKHLMIKKHNPSDWSNDIKLANSGMEEGKTLDEEVFNTSSFLQ